MLFRRGRLARRFATWREEAATRRAIMHLDDRLREDAGLPKRSTDPRSQSTLFPYLDI